MCRYIVLFLIIGSVWAKTGLNKLVLKDGPKYIGKYLNTEGMIEKQNQNTIASIDLEYENLNIHERAIYDAKKDAKKWLFFVPTAGSTVAALSWKYADITGRKYNSFYYTCIWLVWFLFFLQTIRYKKLRKLEKRRILSNNLFQGIHKANI